VERAARGEHPRGDAPAERAQPFDQGLIGIDRDAPQVLVQRHLRPRFWGIGVPEQRRQTVLVAELGDDRAQPAPGGEQAERARHGRLAGAALARHDDQLVLEQ
jgi:hypothetical protein